jgi:hypothetical protein
MMEKWVVEINFVDTWHLMLSSGHEDHKFIECQEEISSITKSKLWTNVEK